MKRLIYGIGTAIALSWAVAAIAIPKIAATQSDSSVESQLIGEWQSQDLKDLSTMTMVFKPNRKLVMIFGGGFSIRPSAMQFDYSINSTIHPMQIDFSVNQMTAETIFELLPDGKLNLQVDKVEPGKPRPKTFHSTGSLTLQKVTQVTLPSAVKPEQEFEQSFEQFTKSHFLAYFEQGQFAKTFDPSNVKLPTETANYQFQVIPQVEAVQFVARAKRPNLKNYTGAIFQTQDHRGVSMLISGVCADDQKLPPMPKLDKSFPTTVCLD